MIEAKDTRIELSEDDFTTIVVHAFKHGFTLKVAMENLLHEGAENIRKRNKELH